MIVVIVVCLFFFCVVLNDCFKFRCSLLNCSSLPLDRVTSLEHKRGASTTMITNAV